MTEREKIAKLLETVHLCVGALQVAKFAEGLSKDGVETVIQMAWDAVMVCEAESGTDSQGRKDG